MNSLLAIILSTVLMGCQQAPSEPNRQSELAGTTMDAHGSAPPALHDTWDQLVQAHVSGSVVDYKGFIKDRTKLDGYCVSLSKNAPTDAWKKQQILAYYINLYNAQTVKLIVDNYPVSSIRDLHPTLKIPGVNSVWHVTKFMVGDKEISLNDVEHEILRKLDEPRIHFAINCASGSCPPLRNEAYTAEKLEQQLTDQAKVFINSPQYNKITTSSVELSSIFNWFGGDFQKDGSLIQYINKYSNTKINENAKVRYLDYDWSLNDVQ